MAKFKLQSSELGKKVEYPDSYAPDKLFPIPRADKRLEIGINSDHLPFTGLDFWQHYEVSWLDLKGKPRVAIANISYPCTSLNIVESKSLKLYFNSLNNVKFENEQDFIELVKKDLSKCVALDVDIELIDINTPKEYLLMPSLAGELIDNEDIICEDYVVKPELLTTCATVVNEALTSNLLKANCPITRQPDWASVRIEYRGNKIIKSSLLRYIVSFRNHDEFHEQCVERIFVDILQYCKPDELTVSASFTRRGGLDINPFRTNSKNKVYMHNRLLRQ